MAKRPSSNSNLKFSLPFNNIIDSLISFVEQHIENLPQHLCKAADELKKASQINKEKLEAEDDITLQTVLFFTYLPNNCFHFVNQPKSPESSNRTDIGIFIKNTSMPFCVIEAKRLPKPKPYSAKEQETEYVCYHNSTKQGGIERFKTGKHASKEKLSFSIMLGYIQENDAPFWHTQINNWISNQIKSSSNNNITWANQDKLKQDKSYNNILVTKYQSSHLKTSKETIDLIHYWINLT